MANLLRQGCDSDVVAAHVLLLKRIRAGGVSAYNGNHQHVFHLGVIQPVIADGSHRARTSRAKPDTAGGMCRRHGKRTFPCAKPGYTPCRFHCRVYPSKPFSTPHPACHVVAGIALHLLQVSFTHVHQTKSATVIDTAVSIKNHAVNCSAHLSLITIAVVRQDHA